MPIRAGGEPNQQQQLIVRLRARVAHAYYDFGRFVATHPYLCISFGLLTVLLMSAPMILLKQPSAALLDHRWFDAPISDGDLTAADASAAGLPDWLKRPDVYVQQFVVRVWLLPETQSQSETQVTTGKQAVKAAVRGAFGLVDVIESQAADDCVRMQQAASDAWLPRRGRCLLLAPTRAWTDRQAFEQDDNVPEHLYSKPCSNHVCLLDLLLGVPKGHTNIKRHYNTNRANRSMQFAVTLFLHEYEPTTIERLARAINDSDAPLQLQTPLAGQQHFAYIFYRPQKHASREYLPLGFSYFVLVSYVYLCASKLEMVKSKLGLTFALVVTVASSLLTATGICALFDLTPTLWGMELFPYLVTLISLENTLCITRSVVWTPVNLDVKSRLARGLSREGWSITKYFMGELAVILLGFFTFIQEIQEFCAFAMVGLVVDFYMQMFFYAPCLSMDLLRLDRDTMVQHQLRQLQGGDQQQQQHEVDYPELECPFKNWLPAYFFE